MSLKPTQPDLCQGSNWEPEREYQGQSSPNSAMYLRTTLWEVAHWMEVTSPCEDMLKIFMFPYLVGTWLFENWSMQSMISKQRSTKQKSTQFLIIALL